MPLHHFNRKFGRKAPAAAPDASPNARRQLRSNDVNAQTLDYYNFSDELLARKLFQYREQRDNLESSLENEALAAGGRMVKSEMLTEVRREIRAIRKEQIRREKRQK